jgi:class 3 adenylate cyclase/tetratricopeptide (TPR) repeat protein
MTCPRCQTENPPQAKFCLECATPLATRCTNCGTPLPASAKFCLECARPVGGAPGGQPRFAAPGSYTPKHLAEKILTSKSALEGERKQVTVLFADLKGSMELLADRDPEEARKLLDPVLERMMEAVHRYEGTVNQVMGDGIMALFGAPVAHEDHAIRAGYAALRMQERVKQHADEVHRTVGVPIHIRVGLNSGEVVVRSVGSDLRMDYSAVGQTTHLAARMEQMAMPGSILLTSETLQLAEGYLEVRPLGPRPVKGLDRPVEVYEVVGASSVRSRLQAASARGLTRFVGRDGELDQLRRALEQAGAGQGQVVAVVGEAGVGKSRLYWEFSRSHRTQGWLIVESSSVSYGKATPYLPVIELLRAYFGLDGRDDLRRIREKVTGKLLALDRALEPALPAILWLLDVPVEDDQWQRLDPPQRRQRALDGVRRLLLRESQGQPVLVLFEDLHWIDAETQALLDGLVESLPTARMLLLVNYRPEYQHRWTGKSFYRQLRIDPLPRESADDLLTALLGSDAALEPLRRLLIERTEGNPFFLEESVRSLVETQVLAGERGAYRLTATSPGIDKTLQIPATARAILAARIDRLAPEEKRLLQGAAVIGKDVPFALLQAIADEPEETVRRGLSALQTAEFLYEARLFPDLEYTFRHALTHEVAYDGLLHDRRRALHAQIADTIEAVFPGRLAEHVDRLAHHAFRGEVWEKAARYLHQAGAKAAGRLAYRDAIARFEQALVALTRLPESPERSGHALDLRFDIRNALVPLGAFGELARHLVEAETLVEALGDRPRLARLAVYQTSHRWGQSDYDGAIEWGQRAIALAAELRDPVLEGTAPYYLGRVHYALGDYGTAIPLLERSVALLERPMTAEGRGLMSYGLPSVLARTNLAWSLAERGAFAQAIGCGEEAVRLATVADHAESLLNASAGLGQALARRGDVDRVIALLERAVALGDAMQVPLLFPFHAMSLGSAYVLAGRPAEAIPLLERARAQTVAMPIKTIQAPVAAHLGEAYLRAGRLGAAMECATQALELARRHKERGYEAWSLRTLGEVALAQEPPDADQAEAAFRQASALAGELGMPPLVAHCHLGLGTLYRRTGEGSRAEEHLTLALDAFSDMAMEFWVARARAELGASV